MRAALPRERDPGRRADEDEARARVGRVDDALEGAHHERVVDGADRQEALPLVVPGQAELPEEQDEVHLGDAHLDVLARRPDAPLQRRVLHRVVDGLLGRRPDPGLVDEAAEVRRDRDVGRHRDEPLAHVLDARQLEQDAAERRLRRDRGRRVALGERRGDGERRGRRSLAPVEAPARGLDQLALRRPRRESVPLGVGLEPDALAEAVDLLPGEEGGVVLRSSGDLESVPLDRVGEHDGRPVGRLARAAEGREDVAEVVAAEVADERADVVRLVEEAREGVVVGALERREQGAANVLGRGAEERLVRLVRHLVDPAAEEAASLARVRLAQLAAVLELDHVPAARPEVRLELGRPDPWDHAVERLAVEIDDPERVAEPARQRLGDRLPEVALVELRVAEQGDVAAARRGAEVGGDVPVGERSEQRGGAPEADRAGGVVDRVRVLGARGVALEPAEVAQPGQVGAVEASEEVLERLEHRRRVGLDADAVARVHVRKPQRGHQGHHRGRRRLVAADLQRVAARPLAVRIVDDAHGEPEHPALDRRERCELTGRRLRDGRRHAAIGRSRALRGC